MITVAGVPVDDVALIAACDRLRAAVMTMRSCAPLSLEIASNRKIAFIAAVEFYNATAALREAFGTEQ